MALSQPEAKHHRGITLLLGCLLMFNPVGMDMFLAAVPDIAEGLSTSSNQIMNSMSALFFGNALGRLILGPLSDRYGRKPVILLTVAIFATSAFASGMSTSIDSFIFWRFIQGFSIAGGHVLSLSVARDLFEKEHLGKIIANATAIMGMAGIVFPILGGQIVQFMPWQSIFGLMTIFGSVLFSFVAFSYSETIKRRNHRAVNPIILIKNWLNIISNAEFLIYAICAGFTTAGFYAYVTVSPTVLREIMGINALSYGITFAFLAFAYVLSNIIASKLVTHIGQFRLIAMGSSMLIIGSIIMLWFSIAGIKAPHAIIIPSAIYFFGIGWVVPQSNALAIQPFPNSAGTASALLGFISMLVSALMGLLLSFIIHTDATYLSLAMLISGSLASILYWTFISSNKKNTSSSIE